MSSNNHGANPGAARTRELVERYGLDSRMGYLLHVLDEFRAGNIPENDLGRLVRLSRPYRLSVLKCVAQLVGHMKDHPQDADDIITLNNKCLEILYTADVSKNIVKFDFMTFPAEIRNSIYDKYLQMLLGNPTKDAGRWVVPFKKGGGCSCAGPHHEPFERIGDFGIALAAVSHQVRSEMLSRFYSRSVLDFACCCSMAEHLLNNPSMVDLATAIKVHWVGSASDIAFALLKGCRSLNNLSLAVSKYTTRNLTFREEILRSHLSIAGYVDEFWPVRLVDALGIDELMELRGINTVEIVHCRVPVSRRHDEAEIRIALHLLRGVMTQDKPAGYHN